MPFYHNFSRGPAHELLRNSRPSSMGSFRQGRRVTNLQGCNFAQTKFLPGFSHGAKDCRPILLVGGEDPCDHAMGKFGYETVQHHRRVTLFIDYMSLVSTGAIPVQYHHTAGVSPDGGVGVYTVQFGFVPPR